MAKTADQILDDLKKNVYAPIYFLQGEESYYIDLISDYIEANALNEAEKGFNQRILYGKDVAINTVISAARSFPMMGQRQVIIVKEAQEIAELKKIPDDMSVFEAYLQNPQPSTVLVFCHKHKKLDKRKKVAKSIEKASVYLESNKIYENQVPEWVQKYIASKGHKINRQATMLLTEYIGNSLERMSNEIDKILINFKEPIEINAALVQEYVGINKDYNIFELQKAMVLGNALQANRIINYFAADPKNHPVILSIGFLHSFFSKLLLIHHHPDKSDRGVALAAGVSPYIAKEYMAAIRRYNLPKVMQNLAYIYEADLTSKGVNASLPEDQLMKELVFKIMH
jgi:DNA polymerase-3 subunit delta